MRKIVCGSPFLQREKGHCSLNYTKPVKSILNLYNKVEGGLICHPRLLFIRLLKRN